MSQVAKAREAHAAEAARLGELEQQVELLRTALAKAANDLSAQEAGNTGARQQLEKARCGAGCREAWGQAQQ
jgi:hypothetical protein